MTAVVAPPRRRSTRAARLLLLVSAFQLLPGGELSAQQPSPRRDTPEAVITEYIRLYASTTLPAWRHLFHPGLRVCDPAADGSIRVRDLEEFFAAQQERFAKGDRVSERLEKVRITKGRRIANVTANFVFSLNGSERRGKLGLQLSEGREGWQIVALVYAYDSP